jgi:hypothetical protein
MAFALAERVREITLTTGTGTLDLAGVINPNERTFVSAIGTGNTTRYGLVSGDGVNWEIGLGTVTDASPDTLSRTPIYSSNANAAIALVGTSKVYCEFPASLDWLLDQLYSSTRGSLLYRGVSGWLARAPGSLGQVLTMGASDPDWAAAGAAALTNTHIYVGNGSNLAADVAASGDLTLANTGAFTIANNAVTNAKAAQMAAHTFKGNNTGSTANAIDLTATQLAAELAISAHSDAAITSPATNDILVYVSSHWSNQRQHYDTGFSAPQVTAYTASQVVGHHRFSAAVTIPANFGAYLGRTSRAGGSAVTTASTVFSVEKAATASPNSFSQVGTITFASGTVTPTFASSGGTAISFAAGDVMRLVAPATPDTTFAGFYCTLCGFET